MPAAAVNSSPYITAAELAALLRIDRCTISRWIASGWLPPPLRLGDRRRALRWRRSVIEQFLIEQEAKSPEDTRETQEPSCA